jgi:hypothetical protein
LAAVAAVDPLTAMVVEEAEEAASVGKTTYLLLRGTLILL